MLLLLHLWCFSVVELETGRLVGTWNKSSANLKDGRRGFRRNETTDRRFAVFLLSSFRDLCCIFFSGKDYIKSVTLWGGWVQNFWIMSLTVSMVGFRSGSVVHVADQK